MKESIEIWGGSLECLPPWLQVADLNEFEVMADNAYAFEVFRRVQTQWRVAFGVLVGLDYNVVFSVFDLLSIPEDVRLDCMDRIRAIEKGYIEQVNKK